MSANANDVVREGARPSAPSNSAAAAMPHDAQSTIDILMIDDSPADVRFVIELLKEIGNAEFRVRATGRIEEALPLIKSERFDIAFVDLVLPDSRGIETLGQIRESAPELPLIVLAELGEPVWTAAPVQWGAQDCLAKSELSPPLVWRAIRYAIERHKLDAELRKRERQLAQAQRISHIGSWEWDLTTNEVTWSEELYRIFGLAPGETPRPPFHSSHDGCLERVCPAYGRTAASGDDVPELKSFSFEDHILRPDGEIRILYTRGELLADRAGNPTRMIGICQDITERHKSAAALAESEDRYRRLSLELEKRVKSRTAELAAANGELESFCYSVSHDLRAPLRAIEGFARILMSKCESSLPKMATEYLELIRLNAVQMGELIQSLLSFARLTRQAMERTQVDVGALVADVLETLRRQHSDHCPAISVGALPPCDADPTLLRLVWVNLLSNAFKYTRKCATPSIAIEFDDSGDEIVYSVRDNGAGFDMQYAGKLFGVFQRLHSSDEYEGTGIGLATVHRIVQRHGGRIWAQGAPGRGAEFFFTLGPCSSPHSTA